MFGGRYHVLGFSNKSPVSLRINNTRSSFQHRIMRLRGTFKGIRREGLEFPLQVS